MRSLTVAWLTWGVSSPFAGLVLAIAFVLVRSVAVAVFAPPAGGGVGHALAATGMFAMFALYVTLASALPMSLLVTGVWSVLARRGVVNDASRRQLQLLAGAVGLASAMLFWRVALVDFATAPVDAIVSLLILVMSVIGGLLAPRLMNSGLAPGRFGPVSLAA